jgi:hypothetical protein
MTVGVDLIVKNEQQYIKYCVESLIPYIDFIFITDTGSTDSTLSIINDLQKKYPLQIIFNQEKWQYDYSYMHNTVINKMKKFNQTIDYYLRVDCDEIFFHSVLSTLKDQLAQNYQQVAWKMPYINFHGGHKCLDKDPYQTKPNICKFNNFNIQYSGKVHEFIYINGEHIMNYAHKNLVGNFFAHFSWCMINRRYNKKIERIISENQIDKYNNTQTQKEAITKFYSQFKDCPDWQMKGTYSGPFPEVLDGSNLLIDKEYSVDNIMDSKCVKNDNTCKYSCVIDKWELSCSDYNFRRDNCL